MKEYNFKEYVKRKMENISDVLNIMKKSINELKENANRLPKTNGTTLTTVSRLKNFLGNIEQLQAIRNYQDKLIWNNNPVIRGWVTVSDTITHIEWNVKGLTKATYETSAYLYTDEYITIMYFDNTDTLIDFQIHYGDGQSKMIFDLEIPEGAVKLHSYSNYYYVRNNKLKVAHITENPREDLFGVLDKTSYAFIMQKQNTEVINPFHKSIESIHLDYIDIKGENKTIEIPPIIEIDKYNDEYKKISHTYYDEGLECQYSFEINNYGFDDNQYLNNPNGSSIHVVITCDIFVESEMSTMMAVTIDGGYYTFYCEPTDIRIECIDIDNKITTDFIANVDFDKITNLPFNIEKQSESDSITMKVDNLVSLYKDISNFNVRDITSMNYYPPTFEELAPVSNVITTDTGNNIIGVSIQNPYANKRGGRGVKFTIPSMNRVSVWVDWQPGLTAELYNEEGELLDVNYEGRYGENYLTHYHKNIFEIKNSESTPITYYIIFKSYTTSTYYNRVFDVKVLLMNKLDDTIKPTKDKAEDGNIILTSDRHQEINVSNCNVLNLTLPTGNDYEEIHLHSKFIGTELLMYNSSISGSNTWNGYGYSSQYIPVEGGSSFSFYPGVDTANIEILQYTDTNNVRGTYISKNTTVTLNANTRYVKLNMWDNPGSIPATMVINGIEYALIPTEKPLITETTVFEGSGEGEITLTFSEPCETYGVDKLEYGNIYEFELIKSHGKWICRNPNNVGSTGGSSGGSTDMTSEDILSMFMEMDLIQPIADENNVVFTDSDGKIFIL